MRNIENYRGREQSYIKHMFLTQYLQEAAYKTLQHKSRSRVFNFIDGFAGPWRISDEKNYSDASFDQALRTLEEVRANLATQLPGLKIRFCFCERDKKASMRLRRYADSKIHQYSQLHKQFEFKILDGPLEENLRNISAFCRDGFTFTFIDPTGWDIDSKPILKFLKKQKGEFLINFMSEPINRHAGYPQVAKSFGRFLADPEWEEQFNALPPKWSNEERVLHLFRQKIKETQTATYLVDFPIEKPNERRVKMRLLLGTHSAKGLEVFRDVQEKVEPQAIKMQDRLRRDSQQQDSLFTPDEIAALQQGNTGVGCPEFRREAEERIMQRLKQQNTTAFKKIAIDILEHIPMRLTHVKDLVKEMKDRNVVKYDLSAGQRKPQDDTKISLSNTNEFPGFFGESSENFHIV